MLAGRFVAHAVEIGGRNGRGSRFPSRVDLLETLAYLLWTVAVGRCVLAALPVGSVGGHGLRELPVTAAVSLALGVGTLELVERLATLLGAGAGLPTIALVATTSIAAAIAMLRTLGAPAAMVPRHAPVEVRRSGVNQGARAVVILLGVIGAARAPAPALHPLASAFDPGTHAAWSALQGAFAAATMVAVDGALAALRRSPWTRVVALAIAAALVGDVAPMQPPVGFALLACATCTLGGVLWLRRADRRGLALACATALACVADDFKHAPLALSFVACLAVATPRASWRTAFGALALVALLWAVDEWLSDGRSAFRRHDPLRESPITAGAVVVVALALAFALRVVRRERPSHELGREHAWLALACLAGIAAVARFGNIAPYADGRHVDPSLWHALAPGSALLVVLLAAVAGPREREVGLR